MNLFYIPCPDLATAEEIAKTLLTEKLVGCANIISGMTSLYWWNESLEKSSECILLLKTLENSSTIETRVTGIHPYETPCILQIPVASINESYKNWLANSLPKT